MTTVLNRKFDVLARSGTCPPCLLDVLSLLVAHANDTELFKLEAREAPMACMSGCTSGNRNAVATTAAEATRASHETVLLAAEHSLRTYAEDLKNINDAATAASARQLRELCTATRAEMDDYHDRLCASAVAQSTQELEVLHGEWLEGVRAEAERLKNDVVRVAIDAEGELQRGLKECSAFVTSAHAVLNTQPAIDAHAAMAASSYATEQIGLLAASTAACADVELLAERMRQAERTLARLSAAVYGASDGIGDGEDGMVTAGAVDRKRAPAAATFTPSRPPASAVAANGSGGNGTSPAVTLPVPGARGSSKAVGAAASNPSPPAAKPCSEWNLFSVGVSTDDGRTCGDGVTVTAVRPNSPGERGGLREGLIVSHVGRESVASLRDIEDAVAATIASGSMSVRLTVYDPDAGRVRILSLDTHPDE